MKNTKLSLFGCLTLFFTISIFLSCSKDNNSNNDPDYKLLGITSVKINKSQISLKSDGVLLDLTNYKDIAATGLLNEPNKKQVEVDYSILTTNLEDSSVQIQSKYSDVSIAMDKIYTSCSVITWIIKITRKGCSESVTYNMAFFNPSQALDN